MTQAEELKNRTKQGNSGSCPWKRSRQDSIALKKIPNDPSSERWPDQEEIQIYWTSRSDRDNIVYPISYLNGISVILPACLPYATPVCSVCQNMGTYGIYILPVCNPHATHVLHVPKVLFPLCRPYGNALMIAWGSNWGRKPLCRCYVFFIR